MYNQTPISNVYDAVLTSLFWAPYRLNRLQEVFLKLSFILVRKSKMFFFYRPLMAHIKILVHWGGAQNKDFSAVVHTNSTRVKICLWRRLEFIVRVWARIWSLGDNLSPWLKFWGTFSFLGGQKFVHPSFLAGLLIGLGQKSQISQDF